MKTNFERLLRSLRQRLFLHIFVVGAAVVMIPQQSFCADNSVVQWRNSNDGSIVTSNDSATSVSRNLNWRTPAATRNSQQVVLLPETESQILLVQHVESAFPPQPPTTMTTTPPPTLPGMPANKPVDIYEQDRFNRGIPAPTPNPPQGATNTPSSPNPSTSQYSPDSRPETTRETTQPATPRKETSSALSDAPVPNSVVRQPAKTAPNTTTTNRSLPDGLGLGSSDFSSETSPLTTINKDTPTQACNVIGFKPINEISCDIKPRPGRLPDECPLAYEPYTGRQFSQTCFQWKASAVCTKGAYFEDVQLERYGHSVCPLLEPVISGAKFFTTIPILPYKAGLTLPDECVYTLGHYRVGNCAPHTLDPLPISVRAILFEGAAVVGAAAIIP
jgi:hypothetical protein